MASEEYHEVERLFDAPAIGAYRPDRLPPPVVTLPQHFRELAWLRHQLKSNADGLPEDTVDDLLRRHSALEERAVRENVVAKLRYAVTGESPLEVAFKAKGPGARKIFATPVVNETERTPQAPSRKPSAFRRAQELLR